MSYMAIAGTSVIVLVLGLGLALGQVPVVASAQPAELPPDWSTWIDQAKLASLGLGEPTSYVQFDTQLPVRFTPPTGWLMLPGEKVSETIAGDVYAVFRTVQVQRGFTLDDWALVAEVDVDNEQIGELGWVYFGTEGNPASLPFSIYSF